MHFETISTLSPTQPLLKLLKPQDDPVEYIHRTTLLFTHELYSSKAAFTIAFFAAVNYNYDCKRRAVKHTKRTKIYQSQITTEP